MTGSHWRGRSAFVTTRRLNTLIQPDGDYLRFSFEGDLDTRTIKSLAPILEEIRSDGICEIIFDFDRVGYVDDAGVTFIQEIHQNLKQVSGKLVCFSLNNPALRQMLEEAVGPTLFTQEPKQEDEDRAT